MTHVKFTTVALSENQHLIKQPTYSYWEAYCIGYTNGKRDKTLDGYYFRKELQVKK